MAWITAKSYGSTLSLLSPLLPVYLRWRLRRGKELRERLKERYGKTSVARPDGTLVWIHGASVGEGMSALPLIHRLCELNPDLNILFTSGTVASANLIGKRLPPKGIHQFIPLDAPAYARRFLDHWRPDVSIWLESELWPNLIAEMQARSIPAIRLNARLTEKSARSWSQVADWFSQLLRAFQLTLALSPTDVRRLKGAGAYNVHFVGNLKFTAPPPAIDEASLATLQQAIGQRPVWLMASSHPGEEEMAARVHTRLASIWPDVLTIIAPRHANRGDEIAASLKLPMAQRSRGEALLPTHALYLADTMGEMTTLYRATGLVVMGGSFTPKGGHNPIEPAQCGAATLIGPDTSKCEDVVAELANASALRQVSGEDELGRALIALLRDVPQRQRMQQAGLAATQQQARIMEATLGTLALVLNGKGIRTA